MNDLISMQQGEFKMRKQRTKETKPRAQEEAKIRTDIIKELRRRGVIVKRIENAIGGRSKSVTDLIVFNRKMHKGGFMEVKTRFGRLSTGRDSQEDFRDCCNDCYINHWVVRSVADALDAVGL